VNSPDTAIDKIQTYLKRPSAEVFQTVIRRSSDLIGTTASVLSDFFAKKGLSLDGVSFVALGSVGRLEATESSDLDLMPIYADDAQLALFEPHMVEARRLVSEKLGVPVSKGEDLTKGITVAELTERESIGGNKDDSSHLTKRVLLLTEGRQITGGLPLRDIRKKVLSAYGDEERTSGRHVLSLCNDIARYFRTLCMEYKAKVDAEGKDWCTRNVKLRHSRKIWYFSSVISMVMLAEQHPRGEENFTEALLSLFENPPVERLIDALADSQAIEIGRLLENYSLFLSFMSNAKNRERLKSVPHETRYEFGDGNPFPAMKLNSDVIHNYIIDVIDGLRPATRKRIFDWFLL
jgi:hypothetical protein